MSVDGANPTQEKIRMDVVFAAKIPANDCMLCMRVNNHVITTAYAYAIMRYCTSDESNDRAECNNAACENAKRAENTTTSN